MKALPASVRVHQTLTDWTVCVTPGAYVVASPEPEIDPTPGLVLRRTDGTLIGPKWAASAVLQMLAEEAGSTATGTRHVAEWADGKFRAEERVGGRGEALHVFHATPAEERAALVTIRGGRFEGPSWAVSAAITATLDSDPEYHVFLDMLDRNPEPVFG